MPDGHMWPALCSDDHTGGWLGLSAGVHAMWREEEISSPTDHSILIL
jgi:hypothetical protein